MHLSAEQAAELRGKIEAIATAEAKLTAERERAEAEEQARIENAENYQAALESIRLETSMLQVSEQAAEWQLLTEGLRMTTAEANALAEAFARYSDARERAAAVEEGRDIAAETATPAQQLDSELAHLDELYAQNALSAEEWARATQSARESVGATWAQASHDIAGSLVTIAGAFGEENEAMARFAQVAAIAQASISMYQGAAMALTLPFPANIAAMAAVLAQGATLVASIQSQQIRPSRAAGRSRSAARVRTDSQLVAFRGTPGEMVDVRTPGQTREEGGQYFIDARGADREGLHRLEAQIVALSGSLERRSVAAVTDAAQRSAGVRRALGSR